MRQLLCILALAAAALAQQPGVPAESKPSAADPTQELVTREFGSSFKVDAKFAPLLGDLDGDGQEDAVVVATSKTPLGDETEFHYRAIDPYDEYFGWGDAKVTLQFAQTNAGPSRYLLVIHNWHAPKAKFVVVNLPFESLSLGRVTRHKKSITSIHAEEVGGLSAELFWDGKKYRWHAGYMGE